MARGANVFLDSRESFSVYCPPHGTCIAMLKTEKGKTRQCQIRHGVGTNRDESEKGQSKLSTDHGQFWEPRLSVMTKMGGLYKQTAIKFKLFNIIIFLQGDQSMNTTTISNMATTLICTGEPVKLMRRIGSTAYEVTVHFSNIETETMEDKLLRMIEREVDNSA